MPTMTEGPIPLDLIPPIEFPKQLKDPDGDRKSEEKKEEEITCVGDIVGQWGKYQTRAAIIYILVYFVAPFQNLGIMYYTDGPKEFICKKPPGFEVSTI